MTNYYMFTFPNNNYQYMNKTTQIASNTYPKARKSSHKIRFTHRHIIRQDMFFFKKLA